MYRKHKKYKQRKLADENNFPMGVYSIQCPSSHGIHEML